VGRGGGGGWEEGEAKMVLCVMNVFCVV